MFALVSQLTVSILRGVGHPLGVMHATPPRERVTMSENTCPRCGRTFTSARGLSQHVRLASDDLHTAPEVQPEPQPKAKRKHWQTDPVQKITNRTLGPAAHFELDPSQGAWAIRCDDHGTLTQVGARRAARRTPTLAFCASCVAENRSETR